MQSLCSSLISHLLVQKGEAKISFNQENEGCDGIIMK
jgi:hypothetical protein